MNTDILLFLVILGLLLVWAGGTAVRIFRQARYYQIEEYKLARYTRWWLGKRDRFAPRRALVAGLIGALLAFMFGEGGALIPAVIAAVAAAAAVIPPPLGEVKRAFKATARARRLLAAAWAVGALAALATLWLITASGLPGRYQIVLVTLAGLALLLLAPLWLMLGNVAMTPVEALLRAQYVRRARRVMADVHPTVIGITGSYGKTTTKNFIADILNGRYRAYATPKSFNTMMGVCIAINNDIATNYAVDYFVVEMGAYIRGEIERICDLTPPQISVVVEIGPQHLERFGSLETIREAKYEIIKALPADGLGVFNWDNPFVRELYDRGYPSQRIAVSKTVAPDAVPDGGPRLIASDIHETLAGLTFDVTDVQTGQRVPFSAPVLGEHNVTNILLAAAVALHEGMTLDEVAFRVRGLRPSESRLVRQVTPQGITIINDAYSANPAGVVSALKVLALHESGRRLLITPGMVELAHMHDRENHRLGIEAASRATDVILVGREQTQPIHEGLQAAGFPEERVQVVDTLAEAVAWYRSNLSGGDAVLFLNDLPDTY
jgi:UDP-N-acetylmuramoyl-tripeptide--D-alanyl-D-alanine ligase